MISTDFVSNEQPDDAWISMKLLFQPWRWRKGKSVERVRQTLKRKFFSTDTHIHLFFSGRSALYYLFTILNLPKESEVIVQSFTCGAVIFPLLENHIKPIYVDIDPRTYSLDSQQLEQKITANTKAIIFQHTFGITPEREKVIEIAKKYNLIVIEDVAHGFEPTIFKKDKNNTIKLLSFGRSKPFSSVFGGALVTNDKVLSKKISKVEKKLLFPSYGYILQLLLYKPLGVLIRSTYQLVIGKIIHKVIETIRLIPREISKKEKDGKFDHTYARGYPNALALLLIKQLDKFTKTTKRRTENCTAYSEYFAMNRQWGTQLYSEQPLIRFPVLVQNKDIMVNQARKYGIFLGTWYNQPVDPKALNMFKLGYEKSSCPITEHICEHVINLPTNISAKERANVIEILEKIQQTNKEINAKR